MQTPLPESQPLAQGRIKAFIQRNTKSRFLRNVAIVASGTAAAQAITMAFAPVLARLYGPEAFGLFGVFTALLGVVTPIAALTYPLAIVLPKADADAKGLVRLSLYTALGLAALVSFAIFLGGEWLLELLGADSIAAFIMLIPIAMLFAACAQVARQFLIRKKKFSITAKVTVLQTFILNTAKAGFGWFHPVGAALIILATVGSALHAAMMWIAIKQTKFHETSPQIGEYKTSLKDLAKIHYDFPVYRSPQVFINAVSQSLPLLMLSSFFGPAAAGYYVLGKKMIALPSKLVGHSVGDVFYPRITEAAHNGENLTRLILKATIALAAVGFFPYAVVMAFGPWLFATIFGADWVIAGEYARWLGLWTFFMFLNNPSLKALPILKAQGFHLAFTTITMVIRLAVLSLGYYVFSSDIVSVALFGVSGALVNIILILIILSKSYSHDKERIKKHA